MDDDVRMLLEKQKGKTSITDMFRMNDANTSAVEGQLCCFVFARDRNWITRLYFQSKYFTDPYRKLLAHCIQHPQSCSSVFDYFFGGLGEGDVPGEAVTLGSLVTDRRGLFLKPLVPLVVDQGEELPVAAVIFNLTQFQYERVPY